MAYDSAQPESKGATYGLDEDEVAKEFRHRFKMAEAHSKNWRQEARELFDIKAGHQWDDADVAELQDKYGGAYPNVTFNLADKYSDAVTGLQINNRQEIRYFPRIPGKVTIDEYATGVVQWCRKQCEAEDEE